MTEQITTVKNGAEQLYHALNKKMIEMASMLNNIDLGTIDLSDPKDKQFDRVFKILEKSETISNSARALKEVAGIGADEDKKRSFNDSLADNR